MNCIAVPVETEKEVDLEQYFKSNWSLHCTTKYCGNGKAKGAKEYAEQTVRNQKGYFVATCNHKMA